ncbi:hypothetical protein [Arthrobacter sp. H5]|uniref:hypothetical protein n=1 Tax=Arthrobacter sp. H5 TaxID=1267973 RepID=UPI0012DC3649|nr:hypothetical protein [Arthrobacter sp. H5]
MTHAVLPQPSTAAEPTLSTSVRLPKKRRRLVLRVLAGLAFIAAVLVLGLPGLIPFGLLLAFSVDSDDNEAKRSVIRTHATWGWPGQ